MVKASLLVCLALSGCVIPLDVVQNTPTADAGTPPDAGSAFLVDVTDVSAGTSHSCAIVQGRMTCWGSNAHGQLGRPASAALELPLWVGTDSNWKHVLAGETSTCATKNDGSLWCWGSNVNGQLGNGTFTSTEVPQNVSLGLPVVSFDFKFATVCAVVSNGVGSCWGANAEGQVGLQDVPFLPDQPTPKKLLARSGWASFGTGQGHTCGVGTDGTLWCWGRNTEGELGLGDGQPLQVRDVTQVGTDTDWVEVQTSQTITCARKRNNALWCWGSVPEHTDVITTPTLVPGPADWVTVSLHTFTRGGLRAGGAWANWGRNIEGQLGLGDYGAHDTQPETVGTGYSVMSTGRFHACGVKNGAAYCTGLNQEGQLGIADAGTNRVNAPTPVAAPR